MSEAWLAAALAAAAFAASWIATGQVLVWLDRRRIVDVPNHRSSHARPTPRGGGIGLLAGALPALLVFALANAAPVPWLVLIAAAGVLAVVSWRDDLGHVPARWRLLAQAAAVAAGLSVLDGGPVFQGLLPPGPDLLAAGLAWVWFVNLTNFMDGIDGITGVEAASIGLGLALVGTPAAPALILAAAALGFLRWNWHPARLFMGDVGSVPLGYLLGALLLLLAKSGHWAPALILPGYYLADATWTLVRRLLQRKRVWEAHREHFYQQAVQRGWSHGRVAVAVGLVNAGLVAAALLALDRPWPSLAAATLIVGAILFRFARA
ncbi:MAG: glycosyltransferase family 4 protein [Alphaproteobacteria bacterium]|nr:glycosyltransferase family 4 protein [Alphaproteobacteria bacterium]